MKRSFCIALLILFAIDPGQAAAARAAAQIDQETTLGLEAVAKSVKRDFRGAEALYTRILAINSSNINAYVQRGLVRRSQNNEQGAQADATAARALIDAALRQDTNNADLYYNRSLADRLLKEFDAAEQDLQQSQRLGSRINIDNDLKAIDVERKMAQ